MKSGRAPTAHSSTPSNSSAAKKMPPTILLEAITPVCPELWKIPGMLLFMSCCCCCCTIVVKQFLLVCYSNLWYLDAAPFFKVWEGCYSISSGGQYVTLHIKIGWKKVKTCWFRLGKMVVAQHFCTVCLLGLVKGTAKLNTCQKEKRVITRKWLLLPVSVCPIVRIGLRWFAISSLPPICSYVWGWKKIVNN